MSATRPSWFADGVQQDAAEYLLYLFDLLSGPQQDQVSDAKRAREDGAAESVLPLTMAGSMDLFKGDEITYVECGHCGNHSVRHYPFNTLSLSIPRSHQAGNSIKFSSLLANHFAAEPMVGNEQYDCATCAMKRDAIKRVSVHQAPRVLAVVLNRFAYDAKTRLRTKIMTKVDTPQSISLPLDDGSSRSYELVAAIVHAGVSPNSGHYITYTADDGASSSAGVPWHLLNDASSSRCSLEALEVASY